jgi:hypothetical protein
VSGTRSPSADGTADRRARHPRRLRRLLPRTFQGRLTGAILAVVALTLALVTVLVINRLDDYFTKQQQADLDQRSRSVNTYVQALAKDKTTIVVNGAITGERPVVGLDNQVDPFVLIALAARSQQRFIADRLAQADVEITFGHYMTDGSSLPRTRRSSSISRHRRNPARPRRRTSAGARTTPMAASSRRMPSRSRCRTRIRSGRPRWPTSRGFSALSHSSPWG